MNVYVCVFLYLKQKREKNLLSIEFLEKKNRFLPRIERETKSPILLPFPLPPPLLLNSYFTQNPKKNNKETIVKTSRDHKGGFHCLKIRQQQQQQQQLL